MPVRVADAAVATICSGELDGETPFFVVQDDHIIDEQVHAESALLWQGMGVSPAER